MHKIPKCCNCDKGAICSSCCSRLLVMVTLVSVINISVAVANKKSRADFLSLSHNNTNVQRSQGGSYLEAFWLR